MAPIEQSEVVYYALKHHSLKDMERAEIERKTAEFLRWKRNSIYYAKPGESAYKDLEAASNSKYAIKQPERNSASHNKVVDIAGQRFGNLVALRRCNTKAMSSYWVYKCDCGFECAYERKRVTAGLRTCCDACKPKTKTPSRGVSADLEGRKLGSLTVIRKLPYRKHSAVFWECRCDCGGTREVKAYELTHGIVRCCTSCTKTKFKEKRKKDFGGRNG